MIRSFRKRGTYLQVEGVSFYKNGTRGALPFHNVLYDFLESVQPSVLEHAHGPAIVQYHVPSHLQAVSA